MSKITPDSPLGKKLLAQGRIKPEDFNTTPMGLRLPENEPDPKPKPRKYRNQPCEVAGQKFDSKHEADCYLNLRAVYGAERVIRQVSIPIGSKRIRPDFLIIHEVFEDGTFRAELVDAKGMVAKEWSAKANHLETQHRLKIRLI